MAMNFQDTWFHELIIQTKEGEYTFNFNMSRTGTFTITNYQPTVSKATELDFCKCSFCPLDSKKEETCPAAESLNITLNTFKDANSYDDVVAIAYDGENRETKVRWPLQKVGTTFVQLAVFAGRCPIGRKLKAYLKDLRPFATNQELSKHLAMKILLKQRGNLENSKKELKEILIPLHEIFSQLSLRFREQISGDAVPNAIVSVDAFALGVSLDIDDLLNNIAEELGWDLS